MKQKTLFDSFPLKNPAKIAAGPLSESRDLTLSGTSVKSADLSNIIDLTEAGTKSPSPFIEAIEDSKWLQALTIHQSSITQAIMKTWSRLFARRRKALTGDILSH